MAIQCLVRRLSSGQGPLCLASTLPTDRAPTHPFAVGYGFVPHLRNYLAGVERTLKELALYGAEYCGGRSNGQALRGCSR
jgi:hypothetical protein